MTDEPLLWSPAGRGRRRGARVRFRAHHSAWSRAARLAAAAPGLVVCPHTERRTNYRLLLNVSTSTGTTPPGRAPPRPTVCNRHHSQWFPQHAADRQVRGPLAIQAIHHPHDLCNNLAYFVKVKTLKILISVMQYFLPRLHYRSCVLNSLKSWHSYHTSWSSTTPSVTCVSWRKMKQRTYGLTYPPSNVHRSGHKQTQCRCTASSGTLLSFPNTSLLRKITLLYWGWIRGWVNHCFIFGFFTIHITIYNFTAILRF